MQVPQVLVPHGARHEVLEGLVHRHRLDHWYHTSRHECVDMLR